jgi:hypothetical protein
MHPIWHFQAVCAFVVLALSQACHDCNYQMHGEWHVLRASHGEAHSDQVACCDIQEMIGKIV